MVSQHGPSPNKAAAILRASLNRRTDPQSGAPILPGSRHGPGSSSSGNDGTSHSRRESGRPPVAPPGDLRVAVGDDAVEVGQESLALTDSIHGPDSLHGGASSTSRSRLDSTGSRGSSAGGRPSSRNSVHDGHGDIESALPFTSVGSTVGKSSQSKLGRKLSAASLVRQVSQGGLSRNGSLSDVDLHTVSSGRTDGRDLVLVGNVNLAPAASGAASAAAILETSKVVPRSPLSPASTANTSSSYDPYYHSEHEDDVYGCGGRGGGRSRCGGRTVRMAAAVAVVCLVGAAIGAGVSRRSSDTSSGSSVGYNAGGNPNKDADDKWEDWEAQHGYDDGDKYDTPTVVDEDLEPVGGPSGQEVEDTTYESTSTNSNSGGAGSAQPGTPIWLSGQSFASPSLITVGSTVSFSADGRHLAISSAASSTVQVYQLDLSQGRSWVPLGTALPGKIATLSGNGFTIAVADPTESTVTTYKYQPAIAGWSIYGTRIVDIWGARSVSLSDDGTTLAVAHYPDAICRICPSVASVFELADYGAQGQWVQEYDVLGAYDFDFAIVLSGDGNTVAFSGRVYEKINGGQWQVKNAFPDFISSHSALSRDGRTAAISLPDCHIFKNTDPTLTDCTNTEEREVSVMEYRASSTGGWWNRKGVSIGPETGGLAGTTALALSEDGNTVAIAVGGAGFGGEASIGNDSGAAVGGFSGGEVGTSIPNQSSSNANYADPLGPPVRRRRLQEVAQERFDDSNEDFAGYAAYDVPEAYVRMYRYDDRTGNWYVVGEDIVLDDARSGATLALSADGHRLAVGSPYGGPDERGYVKVYDMVMQ